MNSFSNYQSVNSYWYNQIPSSWNKTKNKFVFTQNKVVVGEEWEKFTLLTMGKSGVKPRDMDAGGKFPESFENYQTVNPNQIIFCLFDLDETPRTVGLSKDHGMITSAYDVFSTNEEHDPQFWTYFYQMIDDHKGLRPYYTGLRKVVRYDTFMGIEVFAPPLNEQKLIARYLDKKTDQIDRLVEKIQKKIELLQEQRTSLINHYVTKGLNPNVEMKDSGIEWIGEIPKHWKISKVGRHFRLERGRVISNIEISENLGPFPVYSSQTKNNGEMGSINSFDFEGEYVSWTTDGANAGTCFYREGKFNVTNVCGLLSSLELDTNYRFVSFFLNLGTRNYVRLDINPKLMNDMMSEIPFLVVPVEEQNQIVSKIRKTTDYSEKVILTEDRRIDILKEYRQSLISSVVTGKIRIAEDMI